MNYSQHKENLLNTNKVQYKLTLLQRKAVFLLFFGTFLEYFDFMLMTHMSSQLNEMFLPVVKDPFYAKILRSVSFSIGFVFRPLGGILFGYIGDKVGRKPTVMLTTFFMASGCILIAFLPTYQVIGVWSIVGFSIARIINGISSMCEKSGAQIYMIESIGRPVFDSTVLTINLGTILGGIFALIVAMFFNKMSSYWGMYNYGFRFAFLVGSVVALIGVMARSTLRETPDFIDAKRRVDRYTKELGESSVILKKKYFFKQTLNKGTLVAIFLFCLIMPINDITIFSYIPEVFRERFFYTSFDVIEHNLIIFCICAVNVLMTMYAVSKINYIFVSYFHIACFFIGSSLLNPILTYGSKEMVMFLQIIFIFSYLNLPLHVIALKSFPVFQRFSSYVIIYSVSRCVIHLINPFTYFLQRKYGHISMSIIFCIVGVGALWSVYHFYNLEHDKRRLN